MIIHGLYHGDKADLWSVGCIMLELVMGHEQFCDLWMTSYDFDVLQDKAKFTDEINTAVAALPEHLEEIFPADMTGFLLALLKVRSSDRIDTEEAARDTWLENMVTTAQIGDEDELETQFGTLNVEIPGPSTDLRVEVTSPSNSVGMMRTGVPSPSLYGTSQKSAEVDKTVLRNASQAMEGRARNHLLAHNVNTDSTEKSKNTSSAGAAPGSKVTTTHHEIHLPPIDPPTPSVGKARKFLNKNAVSQPADELLALLHQEGLTSRARGRWSKRQAAGEACP